jgi:glycosyltransferase involved in cell wall biosynthesis
VNTVVSPPVVIGIPAHNEAEAIGDVVAGCLWITPLVVVVDDGSTDLTAATARHAGAIVIPHERNYGKGAAIATIFDYARRLNAAALVILDGDGQHDPREISTVLGPCLRGEADVVVGSRYLTVKSAIPRHRSLGLRAFNIMTAIGSGVSCSDSQSGFRAFGPRAIREMEFTESTFSVECEQQFEFARHRLRLAEVPIRCSYEIQQKRSAYVQGVVVLARLGLLVLRRRCLGGRPRRLSPPILPPAASPELFLAEEERTGLAVTGD